MNVYKVKTLAGTKDGVHLNNKNIHKVNSKKTCVLAQGDGQQLSWVFF